MKKAIAAAILASTLSAGCLGPNHLHDNLRNWNATATDMNWLNEIIFLVLTIIPVYGICMFADVLIFNTVDYWGGENPIDAPGPFPETFTN